MNQVLDKTDETVTNGEQPEVGNLAGILGLTYTGAAYGIITEVDGQNVKVTWFAPTTKRRRAHRENKHNQAARRVIAKYELEAALRN